MLLLRRDVSRTSSSGILRAQRSTTTWSVSPRKNVDFVPSMELRMTLRTARQTVRDLPDSTLLVHKERSKLFLLLLATLHTLDSFTLLRCLTSR